MTGHFLIFLIDAKRKRGHQRSSLQHRLNTPQHGVLAAIISKQHMVTVKENLVPHFFCFVGKFTRILKNGVALSGHRQFFFSCVPPQRQVDEHVTYPPPKKMNRNKTGQGENVSITGQRPTGLK
jgi:hypothetical protein